MFIYLSTPLSSARGSNMNILKSALFKTYAGLNPGLNRGRSSIGCDVSHSKWAASLSDPLLLLPFVVCSIVVCFVLAVPAIGQTTVAERIESLQRDFDESIQPLLKTYCFDCHSGDAGDAGLTLDRFDSIKQMLNQRKLWKKAEHRVAAKEMPPSDYNEIDSKSHQVLMEWLDRLFNVADCSNIDPGPMTLRRLNRVEYRNTVRDLMGVDYQLADDFPGDDVGYGFDNIGDVLSLPPILMEKYLAAAEAITESAVPDVTKPMLQQTFSHHQLDSNDNVQKLEQSVLMFTNATVFATVELPLDGQYQIRVGVIPEQAGNEPVQFSIGFNRQQKHRRSVPGASGDPTEFEFTLQGRAGERRLGVSFLNDYYQAASDGKPAEDRNMHVTFIQIEGPKNYRHPGFEKIVGDSIPESLPQQRDLAKKIVNRMAHRGFRRLVADAEIDRLMNLFDYAIEEGDSFPVALRLPLQAILVSPHFLFKVETPPPTQSHGEVWQLDHFQLATRLSYFLWSTMPDDELFRAALDGKLKEPNFYRNQIARMLQDPKSDALVENFVTQWLQLRKLEQLQPDSEIFPGVDLELRREMIEETKLVVKELIRNDASLLRLLDTDFTYVNRRLAEFYGIEGVDGDGFQRVKLQSPHRGGILTHASILTVTSVPTRTSPVLRGKWIMENLLGEEPPPPDPDATPIEDQTELTGSLRQRLEQHRADPNCAVCHLVMDELGFALENFDAVGRWRELDEGFPIDNSGLLPDGTSFAGAAEMQRVIHNQLKEKFVRCVTEKMLVYALGRGLEYYDECTLDRIIKELDTRDFRFGDLIYLIATSDPFIKQRQSLEIEGDENAP